MKKLSPALPPDYRDRLLTSREISGPLFIKPRTAALWARQGRIPAYRIGRKLGFKWVEVEQALQPVAVGKVISGKNNN